MHPIERLRWVARSSGDDRTELAREAAEALAMFDREPAGLVTACRRLLQRHPRNGALWWLAARVLESAEPGAEAWRAADELIADDTDQVLAYALPEDTDVLVVGWPSTITRALVHRGDVVVLAGDCGEATPFVRALGRAGVEADVVPGHGIGAAAAAADLVLVEAEAMSSEGIVAAIGSRAAAAVASAAGVPVWAVAPEGHVLPVPLWRALAGGVGADGAPWEDSEELVSLDHVALVVGPTGSVTVEDAVNRPTCPVAPELLKPIHD